MTIQEFKNTAQNALTLSKTPVLDINVLLEHALGFSKSELLLNYQKQIPNEKLLWLLDAIEKRKNGLPIAYITGHKEFFGYDFVVTPQVLIPKPDTEILVEKAIKLILEKIDAKPDIQINICDMCTGSGCIGISVLRHLKENYKIKKLPRMTFADISEGALDIAKQNAKTLLTDAFTNTNFELKFIRTNLFENVPYRYDVILSNPPYIPHTMVDELLQDGRNEPRLALDGDVTLGGERACIDGQECDDGLTIIKNLIPQVYEHLNPHGVSFIETGEYNAKETSAYAKEFGFKTSIHKDLEGTLRVVEMEK